MGDDDENKESKKKKKKGKKKKDKDNKNEDVKPLVPYEENEDMKTAEESSENQEEKQPVDPTKFINSFSEAKADESKPKLNLPTLVFNDKTVELAPKENPETEIDSQHTDRSEVPLVAKFPENHDRDEKSSETRHKSDLSRDKNDIGAE